MCISCQLVTELHISHAFRTTVHGVSFLGRGGSSTRFTGILDHLSSAGATAIAYVSRRGLGIGADILGK